MERTSFKSFQPKEVGSVMEIMNTHWRVLSCDLIKAYLGVGFGVDQYEIVAEQLENYPTTPA